MSRVKTLQSLFKRYRRPGDIVFAWIALIFALLMLSQLFAQTAYKPGAKLFAQPRFWPGVSLGLMSAFAALHLIGSAVSERIDGRWREVGLWIASLEFAGWFIVYAAVVPYAGYLPSTLAVAMLLTYRMGYRRRLAFMSAGIAAVVVVVLFRALLKVKVPAGQVYDLLPDAIRSFMLIYL